MRYYQLEMNSTTNVFLHIQYWNQKVNIFLKEYPFISGICHVFFFGRSIQMLELTTFRSNAKHTASEAATS